jgi:hypothetical protein
VQVAGKRRKSSIINKKSTPGYGIFWGVLKPGFALTANISRRIYPLHKFDEILPANYKIGEW